MNNYVIFFTGLSASGKTTLGKLLYEDLLKLKTNVKFVDGDDFRNSISNLEYSEFDRSLVGDLKMQYVRNLYDCGNIVIVSGIAADMGWRLRTRNSFDNYIQIYVQASISECIKRDPKGLYKDPNNTNLVGIQIDYQIPIESEIIINTECNDINNSLTMIKNQLSSIKGIYDI